MIDTVYGETITVMELIDELRKLPPGLPVTTEGCDCIVRVTRVTVTGGVVLIERH